MLKRGRKREFTRQFQVRLTGPQLERLEELRAALEAAGRPNPTRSEALRQLVEVALEAVDRIDAARRRLLEPAAPTPLTTEENHDAR